MSNYLPRIILLVSIACTPATTFAQTSAEESFQYGHLTAIHEVRWSPNNRRLISYSAVDGYIKMWDVESGRVIWSSFTEMLQKKDEYFNLNGFEWSPDQTLIATGSVNGTIQTWDAANGKLRWTVDAHTENTSQVIFSNDGKYLLSSGEKDKSHSMKLWEVSTGKLIREFIGDPGVVIAAIFSDDDKTVKTGNLDAEVSEWDIASGKLLKTTKVKKCEGVYAWSRRITFDHRVNRLGARCGEKAIVREVSSSRIIRTVDLDNDFAETMAFSRDDNRFLANRLGFQRITDLRTGEFNDVHEYGIGHTVDLNSDGSLLAAGGGIYVATVRITTIKNNQTYRELQGHPDIVRGLAFSPDGRMLASGSGDTVIRLWNAENGALLASLSGHTKLVHGVVFSSDGKTLISAGEDDTIRLWDIDSRTLKRAIQAKETIKTLALNHDGTRLLTTGDRVGFKLWDTSTWNVIREFVTYEEHGDSQMRKCCGSQALSVTFSPDEKLILSGHEDGTVKIWNEKRPAPIRIIDTKAHGMRASFIQNGKTIATAGDDDGTLAKIWDADSGTLIREISDPSFSYILGLASDPAGEMFATSGLGDTLNLWNSRTGKLIRNLSHGDSADDAVAFSPNGKLIAAGGDNQNISVWRTDDGTLVWQLLPRDVEHEHIIAEKKKLFNALRAERDAATAQADIEIAKLKDPVTITFEHYGEPIDEGAQRIGEYAKPHKRKDQPANVAKGIWLRLRNNSQLPITISTLSMYMRPKGSCRDVPATEKIAFGLCNGQEADLKYGIRDKNGEWVPHGFDFGAIHVLLAGWSVVFSIDRSDIGNGRSIVVGFKFQKENEKGDLKDYGSDQTINFKSTDLPGQQH